MQLFWLWLATAVVFVMIGHWLGWPPVAAITVFAVLFCAVLMVRLADLRDFYAKDRAVSNAAANALYAEIKKLRSRCEAMEVHLDDLDPTWKERHAGYVEDGINSSDSSIEE